MLRWTPSPDQARITTLLYSPPFRVIVKAAHSIGKTALAAALVNHRYDCWPASVTITTAPTLRDVVDLLWTEVRLQRVRAGLPMDFIGPRAPEMRTGDEHWAKGYTASKGESFQGRHRPNMGFFFDEGEGIDASYFVTTKTMFVPDGSHVWLVILNPTTTTSPAALEEKKFGADGNPAWHVVSVSALDHPNVLAALAGERSPIPGAVTLEQVREWISDWCEPVAALDEPEDRDFEFPVGTRWRPNAIGEARILGRRPSQGIDGVWSEALWAKAQAVVDDEAIPPDAIPVIGVDVARKGDNWTVIHGRCGQVSLRHESGNGWTTDKTAGRVKLMAAELADWHNRRISGAHEPLLPQQIPVHVDDDGVGGGVVDQKGDYRFIGVSAGATANRQDLYPRRRSELWFMAAEKARRGRLTLGRLPKDVRARIELQMLAVTWEPTPDGRRQVEDKDDTTEKIGRSPDDADGINLAYYEPQGFAVPTVIRSEPRAIRPEVTAPVSVSPPPRPDPRRRHWPGRG